MGQFWHVTVPTVRPVTIFLLVWSLIDVFQFFDLVYTTTREAPSTRR
jgi:ABC-type sugar transport systems, permease components